MATELPAVMVEVNEVQIDEGKEFQGGETLFVRMVNQTAGKWKIVGVKNLGLKGSECHPGFQMVFEKLFVLEKEYQSQILRLDWVVFWEYLVVSILMRMVTGA